MKKFLLPILMFFASVTGVSAQSLSSTAKNFASVEFAKPSFGVAKQSLKAPLKADEQTPNYYLVGFEGSDGANGIGLAGFATWTNADMILSALSTEVSSRVGHKIIGLRFAVSASLGENSGIICAVSDGASISSTLERSLLDQSGNAIYEVTEIPTDESTELDVAWNQIAFTNSYEVTGDENEFLYGYVYTQVKGDGKSYDQNPVLFGVSTESTAYNDMFLVDGLPGAGYDEGLYSVVDADHPYVPCFQLIMEDPSGETYILGVDGSDKPVTAQYYSANGARLSAPQKGLNIVKMSDGTTKKVVVK